MFVRSGHSAVMPFAAYGSVSADLVVIGFSRFQAGVLPAGRAGAGDGDGFHLGILAVF